MSGEEPYRYNPVMTFTRDELIQWRKDALDSVGRELNEREKSEEKRLDDLFNGLVKMLDRMIEFPELRTELQLKRAREYVESGRRQIPACKRTDD